MADIAVVTGMTATAKMTGAITVVAIRYQFIELNRTKGQASICLFCMGHFLEKSYLGLFAKNNSYTKAAF